ncbi:hypothetical protein OPT61_g10434 [Boeremia exigua]|uniref:Uncharacterized protein n=1 Tax=Boeremia exigua TaxID=749465 RepID=A0ACC2HPN0_9PLEO|nr:hypothetical protein OPT61_g10434 [Boeremia exigua]
MSGLSLDRRALTSSPQRTIPNSEVKTKHPTQRHQKIRRSLMDTLPEELLAQIVSYVEQQHGLAGLCRMNRRLNRIATPVLYEQYRSSYGSIPSRYLSTLLQRPDLADHVKSLRWDYSTLAKHRISVFDSNDIQHALRALAYPISTIASTCAAAIENSQGNGELTDAFLTTALLLAPNLRHVEVVDKCAARIPSPAVCERHDGVHAVRRRDHLNARTVPTAPAAVQSGGAGGACCGAGGASAAVFQRGGLEFPVLSVELEDGGVDDGAV